MKQRKTFLEGIKKKLLDRKNDMMNMLNTSSKDQVSDGQVKDSGDEALSVTMEKLKNSLEQNEVNELRLIEDAIKRLDQGEYGLCIDCEEHISIKRLEHYPYAARCIVCQEAKEEGVGNEEEEE